MARAPDANWPEPLHAHWARLTIDERFLYLKLIAGGFRVGVARLLVQALAAVGLGLDPKRVAQRLMGYTDRGGHPAAHYAALIAPESAGDSKRRPAGPYPFFLAHPFDLSLTQVR